MKKSYGFTLIEMIIVLAVIGIMVATAFPSLQAYRNRQIESGRANTEAVLNKAVMQYYALAGHYPNRADYIGGTPSGKYWDGSSFETSFISDIRAKTGISGDVALYDIDYADLTKTVTVVLTP